MSLRSATRIHDANTINANTGDMTKDEVIEFFNSKRLEIKHKTGIDSQFVVNTITIQINGKRELKGVSFVYFEKSEAYHAILGNNIDGTERYQYEPDRSWVPPLRDETQECRSTVTWDNITGDPNVRWDDILGSIKGKTWADMTESMTDKTPMVITRLPSIIEEMTYRRPDGSRVNVTVQPFFITVDDKEKQVDTYKLFGFIPLKYTADDIKARFNIFSHRSGYPKVSIEPGRNDRNVVFITFSRATYDARFAREIMMYTQLGDDIIKFDFPRSLSHQEHSKRYNTSRPPGFTSARRGGYNPRGINKSYSEYSVRQHR